MVTSKINKNVNNERCHTPSIRSVLHTMCAMRMEKNNALAMPDGTIWPDYTKARKRKGACSWRGKHR